MSPKFARAVDPIFSCVLDLLDRIDRGQAADPADERAKIVKAFDAATAQLGNAPEWKDLAAYALYAWIDSELANVRVWEGRDWWQSHSLEVEYWGQGVASTVFFERAKEAAALPTKDALEVFYVCVVLGFRGFYENMSEADKQAVIEAYGLPQDIRAWVQQYSHAVRLGRELPPISDARKPADVAPPRYGKQTVLGTSLLLAAMAALFVAIVIAVFRGPSG
jgi:type VI secretion system protein ImpK